MIRTVEIHGNPSKEGEYLCHCNDIVNSWKEKLKFVEGEWRLLTGERYPAIVDAYEVEDES